MDDYGLNVRILYFNSYESLRYWFRKIYDSLCNIIPDLIWRCKVNESIDFGTQRWMFALKNKDDLRLVGRRAGAIIYDEASLEDVLEKDMKGTMLKILKGEK